MMQIGVRKRNALSERERRCRAAVKIRKEVVGLQRAVDGWGLGRCKGVWRGADRFPGVGLGLWSMAACCAGAEGYRGGGG